MPTQVENRIAKQKAESGENQPVAAAKTVIGWQGTRCTLPPDWNLAGFSMDHDSGYLRVDAPGNGNMTVQIRWSDAAKGSQPTPTLYGLLAPRFRKLMKRPEPVQPKPDLKSNLETLFKDSAKQAKKAKAAFDSTLKPEKIEGEHDERTAINFSWTGAGRGQGKIWHCATCNRILIAQVVGLAKEQSEMALVASQLFATLRCHSDDDHDLWALYDLQVEIPKDFRLETQKLLSGYLHLAFTRGGERILVDRWGLANMTLKKFSLEEWFRNNALISVKGLPQEEFETGQGHTALCYAGALPPLYHLRVLKDAKMSLRRFPTRYEGGLWECAESNKIYAIQTLHSKRTEGLWAEVVKRCVCH